MALPAAHELYDLDLCTGLQHGLLPAGLFYDPAVQFDGHPGGVQVQLAQEIQDSLPLWGGVRLPVDDDVDRHAWLTPLFYNNYSQIWAFPKSMPNSYTEVYFPVLVQAIIAMALAAGLLSVSFLLGKKVRNRVKDMPYESGITPTGDARQRFSVKFYLVGMLFILFDIEAIFLYPWVVVFRELKMFAFVEMLIFVILILSGFFYIWKKGALDWSGADLTSRK